MELEDLSNEELYQMAYDFHVKDLVAFSRVNKRFNIIAKEVARSKLEELGIVYYQSDVITEYFRRYYYDNFILPNLHICDENDLWDIVFKKNTRYTEICVSNLLVNAIHQKDYEKIKFLIEDVEIYPLSPIYYQGRLFANNIIEYIIKRKYFPPICVVQDRHGKYKYYLRDKNGKRRFLGNVELEQIMREYNIDKDFISYCHDPYVEPLFQLEHDENVDKIYNYLISYVDDEKRRSYSSHQTI